MDAFPAFFPLAGRTIVIAGAGEAADAKARLFQGSPARLVRLEGEAAFESASYKGAALVFVASAQAQFVEAAVQAARAAGAPVNVVDRPDACDFTTPAIIDRGEVVCAIGTGGAAPMVATLLRQDLETRLPAGLGRIAKLLRELQGPIRARLPVLHERRAFIRSQQQVVALNQNWPTVVHGVDPEYLVAHEWGIGRGRFFTPEEAAGGWVDQAESLP